MVRYAALNASITVLRRSRFRTTLERVGRSCLPAGLLSHRQSQTGGFMPVWRIP